VARDANVHEAIFPLTDRELNLLATRFGWRARSSSAPSGIGHNATPNCLYPRFW